MAGASYQTVRITRGRHRSPAEGACVMELASMLAGEPFSDHPRCVDPALGAYLRAFNDRLREKERQRLVPYAAAAVGTRRGRAATRRRVELCLEAAGVPDPHRRRGRLAARLRMALLIGLRPALRVRDGAPEWAARQLLARGEIEAGFALLDRLVGSEPPALAGSVARVAQVRGAAAADLVVEPQRA